MISNEALQDTIRGIREISGLDISVMDEEGTAIVETAQDFVEIQNIVPEFVASSETSQIVNDCYLFKIFDDNLLEFVLAVRGKEGEPDTARLVGRMAVFQIQELMKAFKEHYDRMSFMKNLLLDNFLLVDIATRSKELGIETDVRRVVMLIEADHKSSMDVLTLMKGYSGIDKSDFVTAVDEDNAVVVRDLTTGAESIDIESAAAGIRNYLRSCGIVHPRVAYGTVAGELREISRSYKEAKMALDVAKIFFEDREIIDYNKLGIGRLIYQLPIPLCRMFIREVFKDADPEEFDADTLKTIDTFFQNNLNVSETSRKLFIHRNTLVYRLDKLNKNIGLDLRVFDEAITFKIALMVVKYMKYMDEQG